MTKKEENAENICHWNECLTQYATAEDLFNHVCSTHIGKFPLSLFIRIISALAFFDYPLKPVSIVLLLL
jgi:hypothetical protein